MLSEEEKKKRKAEGAKRYREKNKKRVKELKAAQYLRRKPKIQEYAKQYYQENSEAIKQRVKDWGEMVRSDPEKHARHLERRKEYLANNEDVLAKCRKAQKDYIDANKDYYNKKNREYQNRDCKELTDRYVAGQVRSAFKWHGIVLTTSEIMQDKELIDTWRNKIQLERLIKETKKLITKTENHDLEKPQQKEPD